MKQQMLVVLYNKTVHLNHMYPTLMEKHEISVGGVKTKGTADPRYSTNESKMMA